MIEVREALEPEGVKRVQALADAAADADGVPPIGEDTLLRLRRADPGSTHLVAAGLDELAGYAHVATGDPRTAELAVHPDERGHGLGRALAEAALAAGATELRVWAHGDLPAARALAAAAGFTEVRRLLQLRRALTGLPDLHVPEGVTIRAFRPGADDAAWLDVNARAFAGHPEQGRMTQADLDARTAADWFDPEGFLVAEDANGTMTGFHWTKTHPDEAWDTAGTVRGPVGEVYALGIAPGRQGGGLGRALTAAGLHRMREQGLDRAMLYVEADNAPALALYERTGFTLWSADVMYGHPAGSRQPAARTPGRTP